MSYAGAIGLSHEKVNTTLEKCSLGRIVLALEETLVDTESMKYSLLTLLVVFSIPLTVHAEIERTPLEKASLYGRADERNVGITILYGPGNEITEQQICDVSTTRLLKFSNQRKLKIQPKCFIDHDGTPGIAIGFHVGGVSVDSTDFRKALSKDQLIKVLEKRELTARVLGME